MSPSANGGRGAYAVCETREERDSIIAWYAVRVVSFPSFFFLAACSLPLAVTARLPSPDRDAALSSKARRLCTRGIVKRKDEPPFTALRNAVNRLLQQRHRPRPLMRTTLVNGVKTSLFLPCWGSFWNGTFSWPSHKVNSVGINKKRKHDL